jgi:CarD family transcriptional regulator
MTDLTGKKSSFAPGDIVVYPGHGVGKVTDIETQKIGDQSVQLFVINFERDRMTLRVPFKKAAASGLRNISSRRVMQTALAKLQEPADQKKGIWNRRAIEYTAKINSGNVVSIAEVVRDLRRSAGERERSHSERLLYEQALGRLTHEFAAVERTEIEAATAKLELLLNAA